MARIVLLAALVASASGFTFRRSFRNGYPAELNVSREEAGDVVRFGRSGTVVSNGRGDMVVVNKANGFPGTVTRVIDGGTFEVDDGRGATFVAKLGGILVPELAIPNGVAAKKWLAEQIEGKEVRVEWRTKDARGRLLAKVWTGGGLNATEELNLKMVQDGYAQRSRSNTDPRFSAAQAKARTEKRGLWGAAAKRETAKEK